MKMRQFKVRALAGGIAAIIAMSSVVPMTAQACDLGYTDNETVVAEISEPEVAAVPEAIVAEAEANDYSVSVPEEDAFVSIPEEDAFVSIPVGTPVVSETENEYVEAPEEDDAFVSVPVGTPVVSETENEYVEAPEEEDSFVSAPIGEPVVSETEETAEAVLESYVAETESDEAEPEYKSHVVKTEVLETQLTETKSRRTIIEYLDNGGRVVTNQNVLNGEVVSESSYNTYEIEKERYDEWSAEYVEACRQFQEKLAAEEAERAAKEAEEAARLAEEEDIRNAIAETTESMSMNELLDYYSKLSEGNVDVYARFIPSRYKDENGKVKDEDLETAKSIMYPIFQNMIGGLLRNAPGNEFYGDVIKGFIGGALGFNESKTDIKEVIEKGNEHLEDELIKGFAKTERDTDNYTTLKAYGATLDELAVYAKMRAEGINAISINKNYSDIEKQVRIAELIGSSGDWYSGSNQGNIMKSLEAAALVFKGQSNVDSRDIYNVIYEINKNSSLFSGEAMNKSQSKIEKSVNGFIRNCGVVIECLKAHEAIAHLTQEQIDAMDPQTREIYTRIHTDSDTISSKVRAIAGIFLGDKSSINKEEQYGVLDKAAQYYDKNRTTYVDYGNNGAGVKLQDTLKVTIGSDYMSGDRADLNRINATVNSSGLTATDIDRIVTHAKANGMTVTEYLDSVGFNTDNLYGYKYLMRDAYYDAADDLLGFRTGYDYEGIRSYDMNAKDVNQGKAWLAGVFVKKLYGFTVKTEAIGKGNQQVKFVSFQKAN
ncbi:hypothetical protein SAMN02910292_02815 [Lachnospiraceae bacterium XBB2008]|nr:hypothetical protein SAMN02910292_02815 [Lachnospiraceae bacterium XBB2008]